jgi:hypothetical protein
MVPRSWAYHRLHLLEGVRGTQPSPEFGGFGGLPPKGRIQGNLCVHRSLNWKKGPGDESKQGFCDRLIMVNINDDGMLLFNRAKGLT